MKVTSSMTPSACQRDLSEANFHIFTFGINVQKPANFCLPSSYLAHTFFPEDILLRANGHQWTNGHQWKPASSSSSPIEVFPFNNALAVANFIPDLPSSPVFPTLSSPEEKQPQPLASCSTGLWSLHGELQVLD